jgi:DNA topoisomerase-1
LAERGQERQEKWIRAIAQVSKEADQFVNACDYDVEGSLIGYTVLKYACNGADRKARRMKFSTLTARELREAYAKALPSLDFSLAFAGMCRHEVDWLFGINMSRALTQSALKASNRYLTLSTGRVQGPTLRFVVEREKEIQTFVPTPFWTLRTKVDVNGEIVEAAYENDRIEVKEDGESIIKTCSGRIGFVERLESSTYQLSPPTPFDLSTLQSEAYRHFGYTPRLALSISERLYLDQLISYPRTSSQKLPPSIGFEEILRGLSQIQTYQANVRALRGGRLVPHEGKKEDPAHPAVYPTGTLPKRNLSPQEQKLFDLIVRRFLATFGEVATKQSDKATLKVGQRIFLMRGSRILQRGWIPLYGPYAKVEELTMPKLKEGDSVKIIEINLEDKYTQPPPRYNPSSLLKEMEESGIGTKATRAEIIETLYRRGYLKDQRMIATPLAFQVTEILTKYCSRLVEVTFTRELETKMEQIEEGKESRERVVLDTVEYLKPILEELKEREDDVGNELTSIIREMWLGSITLSVPCPKCGSTLKIVKNPRTKKRFIGCSGKWKTNCSFSLPLPQLGTLTLLEKRCPECGFQLIQVKSRGKRPLVSCSRCYVNKAGMQKPIQSAPVRQTKKN